MQMAYGDKSFREYASCPSTLKLGLIPHLGCVMIQNVFRFIYKKARIQNGHSNNWDSLLISKPEVFRSGNSVEEKKHVSWLSTALPDLTAPDQNNGKP